jgi:hypothetical protein
MRLPRFRLRTPMIAVAVIAVVIPPGIEAQRLGQVSSRRQLLAAICKGQEDSLRSDAQRHAKMLAAEEAQFAAAPMSAALRELRGQYIKELRGEQEELNRKLDDAAALTSKYERAARYPGYPSRPSRPHRSKREVPMRMPRFRVRTLMIAVALVAFAIVGQRAWRHHRNCLRIARVYAELAASNKRLYSDLEKLTIEQ